MFDFFNYLGGLKGLRTLAITLSEMYKDIFLELVNNCLLKTTMLESLDLNLSEEIQGNWP